jgi:hypothetical protein
MQNKKYFFGFALLVVSLSGIIGGGIKVKAAVSTHCCYYNNKCSSAAVAGNCVENLIGSCAKPCTAANAYPATPEGCCDGTVELCAGTICGGASVEKWCCKVDCTAVAPGGTCASGEEPTEKACAQITSCGGGTDNCCINKNKTPVECVDTPFAASCADTAATKETGPCSGYATVCNASNPTTGTNSTAVSFVNPITSTSIKDVLGTLLTALKNLVVTLALIFIVIGGILYMLSAGDPGMVKRAKDCWLFSVIGLAIVLAAPTFLKEVLAILGGTLTDTGITDALTTYQIATKVLNFLLSLVGIIAIISLVVSGGMYMTAYGDDKQITTAKSVGKWAIIGIAIALGSLVIVQQLSKLITGP